MRLTSSASLCGASCQGAYTHYSPVPYVFQMRPLRTLCAECCLLQAQHVTRKQTSEVYKQHKGTCKDNEAGKDSNALGRSNMLDNSNTHGNSGMCNTSNACNSSASSSSHALIKHTSEGGLCMQRSVYECQHINPITCIATGTTRVWTPGRDRGTSHVRQASSVAFTGQVSQ